MKRDDFKHVGTVVDSLYSDPDLADGLLFARVSQAWDLVIGSPAFTLKKVYKNKVLSCRISSSVVRQQLSFNLESYRKKVNDLLQGEYVDKIILS